MTTLAEKIHEALQATDWPWSVEELVSRFAAEPAEVATSLETLISERRVRKATDVEGDYYEIP